MGEVESRERGKAPTQPWIFSSHRHLRLSPGMGESEAERAPLMRNLVRSGGEGQTSVLNTEAASARDQGGAGPQRQGSRFCHRTPVPTLSGLGQRCTLSLPVIQVFW